MLTVPNVDRATVIKWNSHLFLMGLSSDTTTLKNCSSVTYKMDIWPRNSIPVIHLKRNEKIFIKRHVHKCSCKLYSKKPNTGKSLNVHQLVNGLQIVFCLYNGTVYYNKKNKFSVYVKYDGNLKAFKLSEKARHKEYILYDSLEIKS